MLSAEGVNVDVWLQALGFGVQACRMYTADCHERHVIWQQLAMAVAMVHHLPDVCMGSFARCDVCTVQYGEYSSRTVSCEIRLTQPPSSPPRDPQCLCHRKLPHEMSQKTVSMHRLRCRSWQRMLRLRPLLCTWVDTHIELQLVV